MWGPDPFPVIAGGLASTVLIVLLVELVIAAAWRAISAGDESGDVGD